MFFFYYPIVPLDISCKAMHLYYCFSYRGKLANRKIALILLFISYQLGLLFQPEMDKLLA